MGPGTFFRRQAIEMVGMRNPEFRYAGDLEFWFRLALTGNLAHIAKPLATHRVHPESASISDRGPRMAEELVSLVKKVFSHPKLPFHIRVLRRKVFGRVHYSATAYCGYERIASIKHYTISMWYDPKEFAKRMFLKILKFGWDRWRKSYSYKQKTRFTKRASKFAFVSHTLPPSWSGQAVVIKRLLEGMDPNLYCLISQKKNSPDGIERDFIGKVQGRYYTLKKEFQIPWPRQSNLIKRVNILIRIVMRSWRISRILKIENCHAVVAGTGDIADLPAAYIASGLIGTSFFPYLFDDYIHQWREPTIQSLSRFFEPTLLKEASGVIVPNEFLQTEINVRYGIVPSIIRNPYELTDIDFNYCPQSISSESNEIRIVYTGAIYEVNFDAFYNLFEALSYPELQQVKIHIYTSQPIDWLMSHKICGDQVVFHQHVPSLKVREIQASADLLFLPLTFDSPYSEIVRTSAPSKLSDYLASGKPILAHVPSDSYISWYLKIYHCGMVVDQNDSRALSAAIQRIINDVPWAQQLGHNARTHACKDFSPIENRKRFLDLLEKHK
jgi:glycosyltransferase involved in cell wall biosynthesis